MRNTQGFMLRTLSEHQPIGRQLRRPTAATSSSKPSLLSIDEQIRLLEQSIDASDEDNHSSDFSDSDDGIDSTKNKSYKVEVDTNGRVSKLVSRLEDDRIAPLPKQHLPAPMCSKPKSQPRPPRSDAQPSTKRIRFSDEAAAATTTTVAAAVPAATATRVSGLEATVREMLRDYEPSSLEKRPFWCRVCRFQGATTEDLDAHRLSEFHAVAVQVERKMSFCKLCRKQFTSPEQLKEHLKGKGHKDRLEKVTTMQQSRKKFS